MARQWYVIDDRQGSDFGMYRLYTAEEWLEQAIDWLDSDGAFIDPDDFDPATDGIAETEEGYRNYWLGIIAEDPQRFIDYMDDLWELTFVEQGVDGNDFYRDFPEDETPYGYY